MLTNPNWDIHGDYVNSDVLTPTATNRVVSAIQYDYVITQEMLDWGVTNATTTYGIDIAKVLKKGNTGSTTGMVAKKRISVMIDAATDVSTSLNFRNLVGAPWFETGVSGTNQLDIYSRNTFTFTGRDAVTYIHNGPNNRINLSSDVVASNTLYVGCVSLAEDKTWTGTLIYEQLYGTHVATGNNVSRTEWMTNRIPMDPDEFDSLLPVVMIAYNENTPVSSNYAKIQEVLGKYQSPVIVRGNMGGGSDNHMYILSKITDSCGFEFVDVTDNTRHYLCKWTASGVEHCEWDATDGYPKPMIPNEFVTVEIEYDSGTETWSTTMEGADITQQLSLGKRIMLKVIRPTIPTMYLYDMLSYGSNKYSWEALYKYPTGAVAMYTYFINGSNVSITTDIIYTP